MKTPELTEGRAAARSFAMQGNKVAAPKCVRMTLPSLVLGTMGIGTMGLGGCVNITAPSEPIVIELNINIRQEVIYRLAEDAGNTIEENPDIF